MKNLSAREMVIQLSCKNEFSFEKTLQDIKDKLVIDKDYTTKYDTKGLITIIDEEYPGKIKTCYKPPFVIRGKNINLIDKSEIYYLIGENSLGIDKPYWVKKGDTKFVCEKLDIELEILDKHIAETTIAQMSAGLVILDKIDKDDKLVVLLVSQALARGNNVYAKPTLEESFNNDLIKEGAFLIDSKKDLGD